MVYLLASLRMFVYCTVYGDGIHFRRPPAHPPHHHGNLFPPLHLLSTVRYCKFLPSCSFDCPSPLLTPPPAPLPDRFSSRVSSAVGFDKHVVFCNEGACGCDRRHSHKSSTNTTHTHTHTRIYKHKPDIFSNTWITCSCVNAKKNIWELIGEKMYGLG